MATLKDYRDERLKKLEVLSELGFEAYPAKAERTHTVSQVIERFEDLTDKAVAVVGRIVSVRSFGKLAFIKLRDMTGEVQLYLQKDSLSDMDAGRGVLGMKQIKLLDTGDFVQATGDMTTTQTGEKSVGVRELRLLSKSLRPLPQELSN